MIVSNSMTTMKVGLRISDLEDQRNLFSAILASETDQIVDTLLLSHHQDDPHQNQIQTQNEVSFSSGHANIINDGENGSYHHELIEEEQRIFYDQYNDDDDDDEDEDDGNHDQFDSLFLPSTATTTYTNNSNGQLEDGGQWYQLPYVLVDIILQYVGNIDMYGYLLMTCKSTFQPTEHSFQYLCQYIYLQQSLRKNVY